MKTMSAEAGGRRAIGYVRVASISHVDPSSAMEAQAARIRAYAAAEGLELIEIVDDSGRSALDMSREGLNKILAAAAERRIDVIVVQDWARFARDPDDLQSILDSLAACVGIPVKLNAHSERKPNGIPG